jgi:6-phosphogluconolactonase
VTGARGDDGLAAARIVVVDTPAALAYQAAIEFKVRAGAAIQDRGRFVVALSGGSTPHAMLGLLAGPQFAEDIDWDQVHVFWGDERMVSPDDPSSNYGMAHAALLSKVSLPQGNVHRMRGELEPHEAAVHYNEELKRFFGGPTAFDLTFLGLGPDGHTASLFPHTSALGVRDLLCVANKVGEANVVSPWRLTLTYPALNASCAVIFLVEGASKADILAEVLEGPPDPQRLPAQGVAPVGTLAWLLDTACAAKLKMRSTS